MSGPRSKSPARGCHEPPIRLAGSTCVMNVYRLADQRQHDQDRDDDRRRGCHEEEAANDLLATTPGGAAAQVADRQGFGWLGGGH